MSPIIATSTLRAVHQFFMIIVGIDRFTCNNVFHEYSYTSSWKEKVSLVQLILQPTWYVLILIVSNILIRESCAAYPKGSWPCLECSSIQPPFKACLPRGSTIHYTAQQAKKCSFTRNSHFILSAYKKIYRTTPSVY